MKNKHKKNCDCAYCNSDISLEEMRDFEVNSIKEYGFFVHAVPPSEDSEYANYHTHGLNISKDHLDLQIVLPINPQLAHSILWSIVRNINEGNVYKENNYYDYILDGYKVLFLKTKECDRDVLRVILPDQNGLFPDDDDCEPIYKGQKTANVEYNPDKNSSYLN